MIKRFMTVFLIEAISLFLMSCSGSGEKSIEYAKIALEKSGVRDVFFEPDTFYKDREISLSDNTYPYSLHIKEDKYYDNKTLKNPDLRVQSPVYYLEWDQSGNRILSAKADKGNYKDDDALTKGTLAFMETGICMHQTYTDKKGNHIYGEQESVRVYLYDLSSGQFISDKTFYGEELKDHESYSGSKNWFTNKVSRKEIKDWINSMR